MSPLAPLAAFEPRNFRRIEELPLSALRALDGGRTLAVCAVSALEVHRTSRSARTSTRRCGWRTRSGRRFAAAHPEWTVLRHPPLPIGADELPIAGSISSPPRVVYRAVVALGESLARAGVRFVLIANAHGGPRHAAALEAACRRVSRRRRIAMFTPSIRAQPPRFAPLARAAAWLRRRGVGARRGGRLSLPDTLDELAGSLGWFLNTRRGYGRPPGCPPVSYSGWPAVAAPENGRAYAELSVRASLADLASVVEGRVRAEEIRSIASDPAIIQPNFWRWAAAVAGGRGRRARAPLPPLTPRRGTPARARATRPRRGGRRRPFPGTVRAPGAPPGSP